MSKTCNHKRGKAFKLTVYFEPSGLLFKSRVTYKRYWLIRWLFVWHETCVYSFGRGSRVARRQSESLVSVNVLYCSLGLQCLFCFHRNTPPPPHHHHQLTFRATSPGERAPLHAVNTNTPLSSRDLKLKRRPPARHEWSIQSVDWLVPAQEQDEVKRQLAHRLCQRPLICYCHDETLSRVKRYGLLDMSCLASPTVHVTIVSIHQST